MLNRYHPFRMRTKWMVPRGIVKQLKLRLISEYESKDWNRAMHYASAKNDSLVDDLCLMILQ